MRLGSALQPALGKLCDAENSIIGDLLQRIRKMIEVLNFPVQFHLQKAVWAFTYQCIAVRLALGLLVWWLKKLQKAGCSC